MADYPVLGTTELSAFSGRPAASYPASFPSQALAQAQLLFKIATGLTSLADPPMWQYDLAVNAILAMADLLILEQPYQEVQASPFNSESVGSYSYSKMGGRAMSKVSDSLSGTGKTGCMWFDLAVEQLSVLPSAANMVSYGGLEIFDNDQLLVRGMNPHNARMVGPNDIKLLRYFGLDPAGGRLAYASFSPSVNPDSEEPWVEDPPGSGLFVPPWEFGQ